jgi:hypothetical protein
MKSPPETYLQFLKESERLILSPQKGHFWRLAAFAQLCKNSPPEFKQKLMQAFKALHEKQKAEGCKEPFAFHRLIQLCPEVMEQEQKAATLENLNHE